MAGKNTKSLFGLAFVAAFVLAVFYVPEFFRAGEPAACFEGGECQHEEYAQSLVMYMPAMVVLGFVAGISASYFYFERKMELPSVPADRQNAVLSLLPPAERKLVERLAEKGGEALQSELSRIDGIGKVRAHRMVEKLVARGVLEKRQMGKTNIIRLRKDIRDSFSQ